MLRFHMRILHTKNLSLLSNFSAKSHHLVSKESLVRTTSLNFKNIFLGIRPFTTMEKPSASIQDEVLLSAAIEDDLPTTSAKDKSEPLSATARAQAPTILDENGVPLSKNKLKKLKRDQEWEANRVKRKAKRKEKDQEKKLRKRAAAAANANTATTTAVVRDEGAEPEAKRARHDPDDGKDNTEAVSKSTERARWKRMVHVQLPVTLVLDCGFDDLMTEMEIKSLSCQVTRSYSECHRAPYQPKLMVCSFGGRLKERFESVLTSNHRHWKGVTFFEQDFAVAAEVAKGLMSDGEGSNGGRMAGAFAKHANTNEEETETRSQKEAEVVYLTSDSENTLFELKPYSTYIVGGIVDKNRHKGICYKRANDKGIRTARLPIGKYMRMNSRFVLTTNHVVEIMLRWLECGDWGEAFMKVIPKRKGGSLKMGSQVNGGDNGGAGMLEEKNQRPEGGVVDLQEEYQDATEKDVEERNGLDDEGSERLEEPIEPESVGGEYTVDTDIRSIRGVSQVDLQPEVGSIVDKGQDSASVPWT